MLDLLRIHDAKTDGSAIVNAVTSGRLVVVKDLLDHGSSVELKCSDKSARDRSLLHIAASRGFTDIAQLLISRGANVNARDSHGRTPLHEAAGSRNEDAGAIRRSLVPDDDKYDLVTLLINNGAAVNAPDNQGRTPMDVAVGNRNEPVILALDAHMDKAASERSGAKEGTKMNGWNALLRLFRRNDYSYAFDCLEDFVKNDATDDVGHLIETQPRLLTRANSKGVSALHIAALAQKPVAISIMLGHHADPNIRTTRDYHFQFFILTIAKGSTPLHFAACVDVARPLLNRGARVNIRNAAGETPLAVAEGGLTESTRELCEYLRRLGGTH